MRRPGGFAERVRVDYRFAFPIPQALGGSLAATAPLLCAGVTVYNPLSRYISKPGMQVGIIGMGGLGHVAIQMAKKLEAHVTVFDPVESKRSEAMRFGADQFVNTADLEKYLQSMGKEPKIELMLVLTHADLDWNKWMYAIAMDGRLVSIGIPHNALSVSPDHIQDRGLQITGSVIGSPAMMRAMFSFVGETQVLPQIEILPMSQANEAMEKVARGDARYRVVLEAPEAWEK